MRPRLEKNILVISDLHLGEDLRPAAATVSYLRGLARLERELIAFLGHYTEHRLGGRPWRLVVNGDMVDFLSIQIMPDGEGASGASTDDERRYGLGYGEVESLTKLERVMVRHRQVFDAIGRFVAADNELVIITGNHDPEFHYPRVQRRLLDALAERGADPARIRFCPWFYYEAEVVYVEHGHQYDDYCSFDYQLHPVEARDGVAITLAHAGVRYFTNLVPQLNPHCTEQWGFFDYMRMLGAQGARGAARLLLFYASLIRKLIEVSARLTDRASDAARAEIHRARLRDLAASYRIAVGTVEALDRLHRPPVLKRLHKIACTLFLDRVLLVLFALVAVVITALSAKGWWRLGGCAAVLVAGAVVNQILAHGRLLDSRELLRRTPEAIWRIVRAPFIVFGHSHHAEQMALRGGGRYINTGAWLQDDDDYSHAFTHLIITDDPGDELRARLCQWRDGASAPIE